MNIQDALDAVRRHSSVGRTRMIDLYHHGQGTYFQCTAADLIDTLKQGAPLLKDDNQVRRIAALIAWLEAK